MRGTWTITIGGDTFGDTSDVIHPDDITGGPNIVPLQGYGASAPVYLNFGNLALVRSFTMTRTHATDTDAHDWHQTAAATFAGVATVILTHVDYEGASSSWTITNAKVEITVSEPIGVSTTTKIKITGGASS